MGSREQKCSELKDRGITGERSCNCCRQVVMRAVLNFQQVDLLLRELADGSTNRRGDSDIAFGFIPPTFQPTTTQPLPPITTTPIGPLTNPKPVLRPVRVPRGVGPAVPGVVVVIGAELLEQLSAELATLTVIALVGQAMSEVAQDVVTKSRASCFECVKANLWTQKNPQHKVVGPHRTRLPKPA